MRLDTLGMLVDMRDAARFNADDTVGATFDRFLNDRRMRQLVERNFTILGEAANRLRRHDPDIADRLTGIQQAVGLRNVVIHRYDVIDYSTVWRAIQESPPIPREEIEALLPQEDREACERSGQ